MAGKYIYIEKHVTQVKYKPNMPNIDNPNPPSKEKKAPRLTLKQKKFTKEYIKTGNATESVIQAGYDVNNRNTAHVIGSENLQKPTIKSEIERLCDKVGLSDTKIIETIKENINDARVLRLACELKGLVGKNVANVQVNINKPDLYETIDLDELD